MLERTKTIAKTFIQVGIGLAALAAAAASAGEGQVEINQAAVMAGGISPGDAPGFPISISSRGSYRLTGDLVVGGSSPENIVAIEILANDVTLDLAGFSIRCEEPAIPLRVPCRQTNASGDGIRVNGRANVRIVNGTIRGFARHGVNASQTGGDFELLDVRVHDNGSHGIVSGTTGVISRSRLFDNDGAGLWTGVASTLVVEVTTSGNAGSGIRNGSAVMSIALSRLMDGAVNVLLSDMLTCNYLDGENACP